MGFVLPLFFGHNKHLVYSMNIIRESELLIKKGVISGFIFILVIMETVSAPQVILRNVLSHQALEVYH